VQLVFILARKNKVQLVYKLKVYPRTKYQYTTFTTPEAAEAIRHYIDQYKPKKYLYPSRFSEDEHMLCQPISTHGRELNVTLGIGSPATHLKSSFRSEIPSSHGKVTMKFHPWRWSIDG
jgi:hypothetical protein